MSTIVVGVDGGGSKTRLIVADDTGTELASVTGDASAVRPGEAERSADVIEALLEQALVEANLPDITPTALCAGLAGVGRDAEYTAILRELTKRKLADEIVVLPDALIAQADAFGDNPGILLISGTGSVAYGRGPAGKLARCGGWGPICGDEGSGGWLGRRTLSVVTAASDEREPETALLGVVLTHLQLETADELVAWAANAAVSDLAKLAAIVVQTAQQGDMRANSLCALAAEELVVHVRTLARQLFTDERAAIPVALAGGMLTPRSYLRKLVEMRLKSAIPGMQLHTAEVIPVRGAVKEALVMLARA
jgi:glucosamine kinase